MERREQLVKDNSEVKKISFSSEGHPEVNGFNDVQVVNPDQKSATGVLMTGTSRSDLPDSKFES